MISKSSEYKFEGFIGIDQTQNSKYNDNNIEQIVSDGIKFLVNGVGSVAGINLEVLGTLKKYLDFGFEFPPIIHPSAQISPSTKLGYGSLILENAVVKSDAIIGNFCIINALAVVSHDCRIGDYSHLSLGSKIGGGVSIGTNVFLGINSSVNQEITIESNSIIGSGSAIISNVPKNSIAVGNPGKVIKERQNEN